MKQIQQLLNPQINLIQNTNNKNVQQINSMQSKSKQQFHSVEALQQIVQNQLNNQYQSVQQQPMQQPKQQQQQQYYVYNPMIQKQPVQQQQQVQAIMNNMSADSIMNYQSKPLPNYFQQNQSQNAHNLSFNEQKTSRTNTQPSLNLASHQKQQAQQDQPAQQCQFQPQLQSVVELSSRSGHIQQLQELARIPINTLQNDAQKKGLFNISFEEPSKEQKRIQQEEKESNLKLSQVSSLTANAKHLRQYKAQLQLIQTDFDRLASQLEETKAEKECIVGKCKQYQDSLAIERRQLEDIKKQYEKEINQAVQQKQEETRIQTAKMFQPQIDSLRLQLQQIGTAKNEIDQEYQLYRQEALKEISHLQQIIKEVNNNMDAERRTIYGEMQAQHSMQAMQFQQQEQLLYLSQENEQLKLHCKNILSQRETSQKENYELLNQMSQLQSANANAEKTQKEVGKAHARVILLQVENERLHSVCMQYEQQNQALLQQSKQLQQKLTIQEGCQKFLSASKLQQMQTESNKEQTGQYFQSTSEFNPKNKETLQLQLKMERVERLLELSQEQVKELQQRHVNSSENDMNQMAKRRFEEQISKLIIENDRLSAIIVNRCRNMVIQ